MATRTTNDARPGTTRSVGDAESGSVTKRATMYRMVMTTHLCPYGLKAKDLLERHDFELEDHHLTSKEETERFKAEHGVETTPQVWIGDERVGGYDELRARLDGDVPASKEAGDEATTYRPVLVLFAVALAIALALRWGVLGAFDWMILPTFAATAMTLLAFEKLKDVESFSLMFLNYDLLARRWVRYATLYPFAEGAAGVLMLAGVLPLLSGPIALFVGTIGAVSVIKAVWVDGRELKCACVGGDSNVPLGFVSLTENLVMVAMGAWTLARALAA